MSRIIAFASLVFASLVVSAAQPPSLQTSLSEYGLEFELGSMGKFALSHPWLKIGEEANVKPQSVKVDGRTAELTYKNGGVLRVDLSDEKVIYTFTETPEGYAHPFCEMYVPFVYNQGGKWSVDEKNGEFPLQFSKAKLHQGPGKVVAISDVNGAKLSLTFEPATTFIEVQDNREWKWNIFWTGMTLPWSIKSWEVFFKLDVSGFSQKKLVDRFGQVERDYPGKISDEAELKADVVKESAYYAGFDYRKKLAAKGVKLDVYGGVEGTLKSLALTKTGYFHVEQRKVKGKNRWFLVDPAGNAFFHLGICGFAPSDDYTDVTGRTDSYEWLPPREGAMAAAWKDKPGEYWNARAMSFYKANVIRKYGSFDDDEMCGRYIDRVRSIGFNSVGSFSPIQKPVHEKRFPYVEVIYFGQPKWIYSVRGVFDPFDEKSIADVKATMQRYAAAAEDPLLIGRFLANEQAMEDVPRQLPRLDGDWACKRELVKSLKGKYRTIAAFNKAWGLSLADFDAAVREPLAIETKSAFADAQEFAGVFLDAYYSLICREYRAVDPNHMLIGNRWQPGTANDETLCRVAGKYMDVISVNYYTAGIDEAFMKRLYKWTGGKPQFWSEFYYTATKESNNGPFGQDVDTQRERGLAYRNYAEGAASLGFVVGLEWFTLIDQAPTGRYFEGQNGERANTGLFSVLDRPYKDMWASMFDAHLNIYPVWFGLKDAWRFDDPRFNGGATKVRKTSIGHPVSAIAVDGAQKGYPLRPPESIPASRLVMGRDADGMSATFKAAWDRKFLYLLVDVTDKTPMCNSRNGSELWNGDALEIFIGTESVDQGGAMLFSDKQILVGCAKSDDVFVPKTSKKPAIRSAIVKKTDGKGYVAEVRIPWADLGYAPKANATILFDLAVDGADEGTERLRQLMWSGSARNSSDRSNWGRLTLVP